MKAFVGLTAAMSIRKLPRISNYWSSYWVHGVPQFAQLCTKNRLMSLWYNVHLVENTSWCTTVCTSVCQESIHVLLYNIYVVDNSTSLPRDHPAQDRFFKNLRLITILNDTCGELQSVAERFHQRNHGPQHDEAVLTHEANQARLQDLVFILLLLRVPPRVQIYTDKETQGDRGLAHRVVAHLVITRFRNNNYVVYMDSSRPLKYSRSCLRTIKWHVVHIERIESDYLLTWRTRMSY